MRYGQRGGHALTSDNEEGLEMRSRRWSRRVLVLCMVVPPLALPMGSAHAATLPLVPVAACTVVGSVSISPGLNVTPSPVTTTYTFATGSTTITCTGFGASFAGNLSGSLSCSNDSLAGPCVLSGSLSTSAPFACGPLAQGVHIANLLVVECNLNPPGISSGEDLVLTLTPTSSPAIPMTSASVVGGGAGNT
jgi:hypothetical protein